MLKEGVTIEDVLVRRAVVFGLARVEEPWAIETLEQVVVVGDDGHLLGVVYPLDVFSALSTVELSPASKFEAVDTEIQPEEALDLGV